LRCACSFASFFFYYRSGEVVTGRLRCRAYVLRLSFNRGGSENIIAARSGLVGKGVLILQVVKRRLLGLLVVLEPRCNAATSAGCKNSKSTMLTGQSWTELFRLPESSANHHHFPSSLRYSITARAVGASERRPTAEANMLSGDTVWILSVSGTRGARGRSRSPDGATGG
jgi:hypothetical protein